MEITIIVAAHKKYWMPEDPMYLPLQMGKAGKEALEYTGDDTGRNISEKNAHYCELTGLYWAWKNLKADYIGLAHYRRHFSNGQWWKSKTARVMTRQEAEKRLKKCSVLLPKPRHYWIETNYSQYAHAHHAIDLDITRQIVSEKYPAYLPVFEASMRRRKGHRFNMFIMKQDQLDAYCAWLFDILFELEKRLDITGYSKNDQRVFGFVGERLLDVWLDTNAVAYQDVPYVFMERQNWIMKGWKFLKKKLGWK